MPEKQEEDCIKDLIFGGLLYFLFQFAQFALLTQTVAVFGTYVLQYSTVQHLKAFLLGQTVSLVCGHIHDGKLVVQICNMFPTAILKKLA